FGINTIVPSFFTSAPRAVTQIPVAKLIAIRGQRAENLSFISRPFLPICLVIIKSNFNSFLWKSQVPICTVPASTGLIAHGGDRPGWNFARMIRTVPASSTQNYSSNLVHRLAYNGDVAAGQLAVFQGGPSRTCGNEAPISGFIRVERAT